MACRFVDSFDATPMISNGGDAELTSSGIRDPSVSVTSIGVIQRLISSRQVSKSHGAGF